MKRRLLLVLLAAGMILAACGDDDSDSGSYVPPGAGDQPSGPAATLAPQVPEQPTTTVSSAPMYLPLCGQGQHVDPSDLTACMAATVDSRLVPLSANAACSVVGDLEGQFTTSDQMKSYLECVLPGAVTWIDSVYAQMPHPNNYFYVPLGVTGSVLDACPYAPDTLAYCWVDGNVYLGELAIWDQYTRHGDAAPVVVLAHELTHRFQHAVGMAFPVSKDDKIQGENQSDCGAGVFMAYASAQGWMDPLDDIVDLGGSLIAAGSAEGPNRDHGTMQERLQAFDVGYQSGTTGMNACNSFVPAVPIID